MYSNDSSVIWEPLISLKSMWTTFSVRLSRSAESATEAISLALHWLPDEPEACLIYCILRIVKITPQGYDNPREI